MCVCWSRRKPDSIQQVKERTEDKKCRKEVERDKTEEAVRGKKETEEGS